MNRQKSPHKSGSYSAVTESDITALKDLTAAKRVFSQSQINEDYFHDELGGIHRAPDVLVKVTTVEEISQMLAYANKRLIPVTVRGSGTGLVGGAVALYGGILLDTTLMNRILELDEDNLTLTVEPGVLLMDVAAYAESHGFLYPPDPGEKSATIAGNISTNAGGMRAVKYGVTRDYVRGLTIVTAAGDILELGGKTVKNSSGYSLKDLIVGSEGTLAVIARATLKLVPLPPISLSLLIPYVTMEEALTSVPAIVTSKTTPTAIEYFSRQTVVFAEEYLGKRFPDTKSPHYILLTFDGASESFVQEQLALAAELCISCGATDAYLVDTEERKKSVWSARGAFLEAIKSSTTEMDECDVVVPRSSIAHFISFTQDVSRDLNIRIPGFGHAGDGNLHLYLCRDSLDEADWKEKREAAFERLYEKAATLRGQVSGEHGIGQAKRHFLAHQLGTTQIDLMRGIKAVFDPNNILNPGKVC